MKRQLPRVLMAVLIASLSVTAQAQSTDVDVWLKRVVDTQNAAYEPIDDLTRKTKMMGTNTFEFYEKAQSFEVDGQTVYALRMVMPGEIQQRHNAANGMNTPSATEMAVAADAIEMAGIDMERAMMNEMATTGLPGNLGPMLANPPPDQPWLSPNPRDMTSMYAMMLRAGAEGEAKMAAEQAGMPAEYAQNMQVMRSKMRVNGFTTYSGREAVDIGANDLNMSQIADGQEMNCQSMQTLIDTEWNIPVYFKMNCSITDGGETRQMSIERESYDFRTVPSCGAYREPFRSVMRIGGVMTPEQQAQMAEASAQLEELEKQMASMPPAQKKMMESMMGGQLDMIRGMASGGGIEIESTIVELRCNTGLPDPIEIANTTFGGTFTGGSTAGVKTAGSGGIIDPNPDLLKMIQVDLVSLDYQPGNTDGVLDKLTVVAISQFQATRGMEVTGQPSPQLAGILSAAVDAL